MGEGKKYKMINLSNDPNIEKISECVRKVIPNARIILFGSRAKGTARKNSDYDILVIIEPKTIKNEMDIWKISSKIRNLLAQHLIPADVIVRTTDIISKSLKRKWTAEHEAIKTGIEI